jgi:hypothetical protein
LGCRKKAKAARLEKREKTRDFMVNLNEMASISAHFRPVFAYSTARLYFSAARRETFPLSRGRKSGARKSF